MPLTLAFLGFALSATPGPSNAEMLRRGLRQGFGPAFLFSLGVLLSDMLYATLTIWGFALAFERPGVKIAVTALGACMLAWMGTQSVRDGLRKRESAPPRIGATKGAVLNGILVNLFNPATIVSWIGILGAASATIADTPRWIAAILVLAGAFAWNTLLCALAHGGRRVLTPRTQSWVAIAAGCALLAYAGYFAYEAIGMVA
jgi:chemosensory pili system protein ChpE